MTVKEVRELCGEMNLVGCLVPIVVSGPGSLEPGPFLHSVNEQPIISIAPVAAAS